MTNQIAQQVDNFFSDKEQWDSFLEICQNKDQIRNFWFSKLKESINEQFVIKNVVDKWGFISWGIWDFRWFIKEFEKESLCLWYHTNTLHLWCNGNLYDRKKIFEMLQEKKYTPIVSAFERQDEIYSAESSDHRIVERGNFCFGDRNDGHLDIDQLMWYANYRTDEFVTQLTEKVNRFRKNQEVTDLLIEINKEAKKK